MSDFRVRTLMCWMISGSHEDMILIPDDLIQSALTLESS
jgi:hypothetical protein